MGFFGLKRVPLGTLWLCFLMVAIYFMLSGGTLYIQEKNLYSLAYAAANPLSLLTHMFVHVGILHLLGNILPLILFGLVLEAAVLYFDVMIIFLLSGILSALVFSSFNPSIFLIGGSAGIAGIMASALFTRPRQAIALLILVPLLTYSVVYPAAQYAVQSQETGFTQATNSLAANVTQLQKDLDAAVKQNRTQDANRLNATLSQLNASLASKKDQLKTTETGKKRETTTPTDLPVHFYGAGFGIAYLYLFREGKLREGKREFYKLGAEITAFLTGFKRKEKEEAKTRKGRK